MKNLIKRLRCWWIGHDYTHAYVDKECCWCGQTIDYGLDEGAKWRIKQWIWWNRGRLHDWFHGCPDCGKRFGRHDETKEHLPF